MGLGLALLITWEMTVCSGLASSASALSLACASARLLCGPKARASFHFPSLLGESQWIHVRALRRLDIAHQLYKNAGGSHLMGEG